MKNLLVVVVAFFIFGCNKTEQEASALILNKVEIGDVEIQLSGQITENVPVDRPITLVFSEPVDPASATNAITLFEEDEMVSIQISLNSGNRNIVIFPTGLLKTSTVYTISISDNLKGANQYIFSAKEIKFKTIAGDLQILSLEFENSQQTKTGRTVNVPLGFSLTIDFSNPVNQQSLLSASKISGIAAPNLQFTFSEDDKKVTVSPTTPLTDLTKFTFEISNALKGAEGQSFPGTKKNSIQHTGQTMLFL
jgi:hypothetical protein